MTDILISDLHLDESRPDLTAGFLKFLATGLNGADSLYILGDFFEVWLGDDHHSAFNQSIIDALNALDLPIFFMHGNRDFLIGNEFCEAIGATLLPDPSVVELGGESVLLMHGDSLCTADTEYMKVRAMLRNPAVQQDLLSKPLEERAAIAQQARGESQAHTRAHTRESAADIMDVTPAEVIKAMQAAGVKTLIHGHTHRPATHQVELTDGQRGQRIVLGDWDKLGWRLIAQKSGFKLESFEL
jgi:UDP-2,3-diacylglucosamine hydrolase